jgi:predicted amidophosphoribosyltransferase
MIDRYCADHHRSDGSLCPECQDLLTYAEQRLVRCRYQSQKPTCARCPVHCYAPSQRERVRIVMRYAGPKMLWKHPFLAILHIWDAQGAVPGY